MSKTYTPCGGCGATEPDQRCIGCMHPFTEIKPDELPVTPEWELINRIVSQWGNAIEMPNMEQWLKDYAATRHPRIGWVKASNYDSTRGGVLFYRFLGPTLKSCGTGNFSGGVFHGLIGDHFTKDEWEYLYILDESPAAGISQDAHEKEVMMSAFDKVRQIFEGRSWIMEGRGGYPYNDDRYKEEVRYMYDEFDKVFKDTWGNIESKSIEYREWIIAEYLQKDHPSIHDILNRLGYQRAGTTAAGREEAVEFHDWVSVNEWEINYQAGHIHTTAELYELFKQQKEK